MKRRVINHSISGVFVFLLLGIFAVFATIMVLLGAKVYRGVTERGNAHLAERVGPAYLRSMLRSTDETGSIRLEELDGVQTISLINVYDGEEYATRMYVYDGMLYEWFTEASAPFNPESGDSVCAADSMTVEAENGLLTIHLQSGEQEHVIKCALYAARP